METHPIPRARIFQRLRRIAGGGAMVLLIGGCGRGERAPVPYAADAEMARAWAEMRGMAARTDSLADEQVIALGYAERLRLGLGSPFRLMDYALLDPRLSPAARARTAAALLQATREGRAYAMDAHALASIGVDSAGRTAERARMHRALIDDAVASADDPRVGELAVRAAYALAAAENRVARHAPTLAAQAAALARDRVLARRDAERLLAAADSAGRHPLPLLREWRAARRFAVEAPTGAGRPPHLEVRASAQALPLAARVRAVAAGLGALERERVPMPRLSARNGRRLSKLARAQDPPPSAPVAVTLDRYGAELRRTAGRDGLDAVEGFIARGRTEERFAAELARVQEGDEPRPTVAVAALEAAVALRAYAQETAWYPGFPAPTTADLKRAYGLAAVGFDADVPMHWRPFYRRMLGESLADLESVLPGLDLHGLSFRFGATGRGGTTLAVHFPGPRRIHLPPGTGPGTIAHEVAHDLDWQMALRRYDHRGAYATDLAVHRDDADAFAAAVRRLPLVAGPRPGPEGRGHDTRPAEAFARLFDGYVTSTLAARGRGNGYLSSLQDEVLTGHGTAVAPDARGEGAEAFLPLLMTAAPMTPAQAEDFRLRWGAHRAPGPLSLLARVAAAARPDAAPSSRWQWHSLSDRASLDDGVRARIAEVEAERDGALAERAAAVCANPFLSPRAEGEAAVRALVVAAADARIDAILRRFARDRRLPADTGAMRAAWLSASARPAGIIAPACEGISYHTRSLEKT
jgi:hypothetical protein